MHLQPVAFVVPSPSCPDSFAPHARTVPFERSAMLRWPSELAAIATTFESPGTGVGVELGFVVPSPSWPLALSPHARTVPSESSAKLCSKPPAIATTFERPGTGVGLLMQPQPVVVGLP